MADLFKEIIPSILQTKKYALLTEQDEKSYAAFMVGRALSNYQDTVAFANEINQYPNVDNKLKYDFLLNIVKPYKRQFAKWHKRVKTADLDVVKEYYGYSDAKAYDALRVLSDDQINTLRTRIEKGD
jgi:hypothetical protein